MKLFKLLIIPLLLTFGYLALFSYPYFFSKINAYDSLGFLSMVEEMPVNIRQTFSKDRVTDKFDNHLLKGEKVMSKFKATENNFGILLFRFAHLSAIVKDSVIFRIKEEGSANWYYEQKYKADQFQPDQYFTFGFPPILNSRDKVYIFEIESLSGTYKNGIGLSAKEPKVALVYKYSREDLKNFNTLSSFFSKKFIYVLNNLDIWQNWQILTASLFSYIFILFIRKKKITFIKKKRVALASTTGFLPLLEWNLLGRTLKRLANKMKSKYLLQEKTIVRFSKKLTRGFIATQFYSLFLNTNMKKRLTIGLLIFLIAFLYRFSATSVDQLGVNSFYAGLGGQGDYDQFIRAATCAVRSFCPAILGQNFLFESIILGIFYEIFGFTGGLKAYLYLMLILSSIVATLPYVLLSRKTFFTIGGIIGSLFLATSDFLTHLALNLPPDNGSLFTFSMFYVVYFLTLNIGTIRWLLLFGLMGTIDGLNKLILLINDLAVFLLFVPVFFYEKANKIKKFPFVKLNPKLIFYSILPLLVFLAIYSAWEYIVQIKFGTPYYLRALIEGGSTYASSTDVSSVSFKESLSRGNILEILYYYVGSAIVMQKRIISYAGLNAMFLAPIFIGLLFATFRKPPFDNLRARKFFIAKLISIVIFSAVVFMILELFRNNYLGIQNIGQYVYAWSSDIYINVFLFASIIFLFVLNFKYKAIKLALPILPYVVMIIILTKNAPWERMLSHIIVWSIILFSFLIDWILSNTKKDYVLRRLPIGLILLVLFIAFYTIPKTTVMLEKLYSGINSSRNEVEYLRWVNSNIPENAIVLAGGKSDLITVAQNIKRPIIYSALWTAALLIKPNEIPGVKSTDFAILDQLKINEMPGVTLSDFSIVGELKNKDNFKKNKYLILEDDIYIWRNRLSGVADAVFTTYPKTTLALHAEDFSIKVYKSNSALNKGIYELKQKAPENL